MEQSATRFLAGFRQASIAFRLRKLESNSTVRSKLCKYFAVRSIRFEDGASLGHRFDYEAV